MRGRAATVACGRMEWSVAERVFCIGGHALCNKRLCVSLGQHGTGGTLTRSASPSLALIQMFFCSDARLPAIEGMLAEWEDSLEGAKPG